MRRRSLPSRVSDAGGSTMARACIPARQNCSSPLMEADPTARGAACGSVRCNGWPTRPGSASLSVIFRREPANGRRSNIGSSLTSPSGLRAKPLVSLETVIELISHTTTQQGLVVTAIKDSKTSPTGIKVSDEELKALHITRDDFHGEWNDTFQPQDPASDGHVLSV